MSIATELAKLQTTKAAIKQALTDKGQSPTNEFATYSTLISNLGIPDNTTFGYSVWKNGIPQAVLDYAKNGTYGNDLFYGATVNGFINTTVTIKNGNYTFQNFNVDNTDAVLTVVNDLSSENTVYLFYGTNVKNIVIDKLPGVHSNIFGNAKTESFTITDLTGFEQMSNITTDVLRVFSGKNFGKDITHTTIDFRMFSNIGVDNDNTGTKAKEALINTFVNNSVEQSSTVTLKFSTATKALFSDENITTLTSKGYTLG